MITSDNHDSYWDDLDVRFSWLIAISIWRRFMRNYSISHQSSDSCVNVPSRNNKESLNYISDQYMFGDVDKSTDLVEWIPSPGALTGCRTQRCQRRTGLPLPFMLWRACWYPNHHRLYCLTFARPPRLFFIIAIVYLFDIPTHNIPVASHFYAQWTRSLAKRKTGLANLLSLANSASIQSLMISLTYQVERLSRWGQFHRASEPAPRRTIFQHQ